MMIINVIAVLQDDATLYYFYFFLTRSTKKVIKMRMSWGSYWKAFYDRMEH
jgi:hypothetical protein